MLAALIKKELLVLMRDLHGLAALFLMPLLFIVVMSLALKDVYNPRLATLPYAVAAQDSGALSRELVRLWQQRHGAPQPLPPDWRARLQAGELKYVIVIDAGLQQALTELDRTVEPHLHLLAEPAIDGNLFNALAAELEATAGPLKVRAAIQAQGAPIDPGVTTARLVTSERFAGGKPQPSSVQHSVAAWLVFGMFFVVAGLSNLFVEERSGGVLARLRALGVPHGVLLASKALPYFGVNLVQAVLMLMAGVWLIPLLGGDALSLEGIQWPALVLVVGAVGVAAVSLALMLSCLLRTHAQANAVGPVLNVLMGAIGGVMVPTFVMPVFMQKVAAYSPMNWGLEGLLAVLLRGGGATAAMPQVLRLLAFAVLMLLAAWLLIRRNAR